ncbi:MULTISPECIES: DUF4381 family protein [unclassified Aureimonas]|uniref:DUF4381 family protein n=1 Tax=unclassified Aureimonas TaxID=2615206 RepID=UPI0006F5D9BC|nr:MULTISPECIES: DUF4381 family protein [unclassified Aureimonas]KQT52793.1 hypothetical protein ASG62_12765 [Aureimonas sp. Leaf427]KQT80252.1 hypothetical protein ASG54_06615 [Aureimonas sp. Leaf460]
MPDADKILEALRPAHLPPAAANLSLGDVALPVAIGLLLALLVALLWPRRIPGRARVAASALAELKRAKTLPPAEARIVQVRLLRRVVAARDGREAALLNGEAFAAHLDRSFATDFFTAGPGRALVCGLYEPGTAEARGTVSERLEALFSGVRA